MATKDKLSLYKQVDLDARVEGASPHQLILILFEEVIAAIKRSIIAMESGDLEQKGLQINRATKILTGLRESLDVGIESDLPHQLDRLYEYMQRTLYEAHRENDLKKLKEIMDLLLTIKSGWEGISDRVNS